MIKFFKVLAVISSLVVVCATDKFVSVVTYESGIEKQVCMDLTSSASRDVSKAHSRISCAGKCLGVGMSKCVKFSFDQSTSTCVLTSNFNEPQAVVNDCRCRTFRPKIGNVVYPGVLESCLKYKEFNYFAESGMYTIMKNGASFKVWCDMESNGGGYTFLIKDSNIGTLNANKIDHIFSNRTHFLMVIDRSTNIQNYCVVSQLAINNYIYLSMFLQTASVSFDPLSKYQFFPMNFHILNPPYLVLPFQEKSHQTVITKYGFTINGQEIFATLSNKHPCYISLFQNTVDTPDGSFFTFLYSQIKSLNASCDGSVNVRIPRASLFYMVINFEDMFRMHTYPGPGNPGILAAAIGFR